MPPVKITESAAAPIEFTPEAGRILDGMPRQTITDAYASADGRFSAGLWACEPGSWRIAYTEHELCHLLEGEIIIRGDDGSVARYEAGDSFVMPAGFTGIWELPRRARKLYAIYQP